MQNQRITHVLLSLVVLLLLALVGTQMAWWGPTAALGEESSSAAEESTTDEATAPSLCKQWEVKYSKPYEESGESKKTGFREKPVEPGWEPFSATGLVVMSRRCVK